jgi:hypothetical protein
MVILLINYKTSDLILQNIYRFLFEKHNGRRAVTTKPVRTQGTDRQGKEKNMWPENSF